MRIIVFLFEELLESFDCTGVQSTGPALGLTDFGPSFFQGLVLEVVALEQFSLFFRELLDGGADPPSHLLELQALVSRNLLIAELKAFSGLQAGRENHGQARNGRGDLTNLVVNGPTGRAVAVGQVAQVRGGALRSRGTALEHPHLPQPVEDGAFDAVVGKGEEIGPNPSIETVGGLEQADLTPRHQFVQFVLGIELFAHLCRERTDVGPVLLEDLRFGLPERHE